MSRWNTIRLYVVSGLIVVISFSVIGLLMPAKMDRAINWLFSSNSNSNTKTLMADYQSEQDKIVEMTLEKLVVGTSETGPAVLLKEKNGKRYLPVSIGISEARSIAIVLQGAKPPRPMTHDLLRGVIDALGAKVQFVIIEDLKGGIYYARVILNNKGKTIEMDSRPSDAIALSLRTGTPIYAREKLLETTPSPGNIKSRADM